jgi:regulator of protease activity HflC (stomatin/prohibitin superfamily)
LLGLRFIKASPTTYILHYVNGKAHREGSGLSFFYYAPTSTLVAVPLASVDVPFVFNEVSADYQQVTIQGQFSYRVSDPKVLARVLDFSIYPNGRYVSEDPRKLDERLTQVTQVLANAIAHRLKLRELLVAHELLVHEVLDGLKISPSVTMLGVEILGFSVLSIKPSPETAKALEAEARELLMRHADEAIYARRNAAVALERQIKESELNTEIAVEEKQRQIREAKMSASIALEQQRVQLIERRSENDKREADSKSYALNAMVTPLRDMDWRTLMALSAGRTDSKLAIAMAFRDLADHAEKIGTLNITPDLLNSLLEDEPTKPANKR